MIQLDSSQNKMGWRWPRFKFLNFKKEKKNYPGTELGRERLKTHSCALWDISLKGLFCIKNTRFLWASTILLRQGRPVGVIKLLVSWLPGAHMGPAWVWSPLWFFWGRKLASEWWIIGALLLPIFTLEWSHGVDRGLLGLFYEMQSEAPLATAILFWWSQINSFLVSFFSQLCKWSRVAWGCRWHCSYITHSLPVFKRRKWGRGGKEKRGEERRGEEGRGGEERGRERRRTWRCSFIRFVRFIITIKTPQCF